MILIGNSNIDCFNRLQLESESPGEGIQVQWVGALKIDHFAQSNPIGQKTLSLIQAEKGWSFLSIGTHDIFQLFHHASQGSLQAGFQGLIKKYELVFSTLGKRGRFAWLVFPQPLHSVVLHNLPDKEKLAISKLFNKSVEAICAANRIPVINPLKRILDSEGKPLPEYLQKDATHINEHAASFYLDEIRRLTGLPFRVQVRGKVFEPRSENESFCSLLLNNLGLPSERIPAPAELSTKLISFMDARCRDRGIDLSLSAETGLASSGLFDSLDLVELYTAASELMGIDLNFDVNLRELDTIANIVAFIYQTNGLSAAGDGGPAQSDFICSLREDFDSPGMRPAILSAERHLGELSEAGFGLLVQSFRVASEGNLARYGVPLFWMSLNWAARKDYVKALDLLKLASAPTCLFPLAETKMNYYRELWRKQLPTRTWDRQLGDDFVLRNKTA